MFLRNAGVGGGDGQVSVVVFGTATAAAPQIQFYLPRSSKTRRLASNEVPWAATLDSTLGASSRFGLLWIRDVDNGRGRAGLQWHLRWSKLVYQWSIRSAPDRVENDLTRCVVSDL